MDNEILNKELTSAMISFANNPSVEAERQIYLAFKDAIFLMPAKVEGNFKVLDDRIIELQKGATAHIAQFTNEGNTLYPAFTDMMEVNKWNSDLEADDIYLVKMKFKDYEDLLAHHKDIYGFVVNPYNQDLIIGETQFHRYHEIIFEEEHKDAYTAPITTLLDELRTQYSLELEERIYRMFQNLRLLMPVQVPNESCIASLSEEGVAEIIENTPINVMPLENEKGEQVFPVFTDLYEAKRSGIDVDPEINRYLIEINFDGLDSLVSMNENVIGFSINPFNHNIIIGPEQMEKYHHLKGDFNHLVDFNQDLADDNLANQLDTTPEEEAEILAGFSSSPYQLETDVENPKLEKALSRELSAFDSVNRAYLAQKMYLDHDSYLVVIDKERDGKTIISDLREVAMSVLGDEQKIEFLSHNEDEAKPILAQAQPFYEKGKKRKFLGIF